MCGIIGTTGRREAAVREAAKTFAYRGPDSFGLFADEHLTLGFNRLAIIDLDERSNQPLFDPSGDIGVVLNGEIYNFRELKKDLGETGRHAFRTEGDAEVVLAAYREWGEAVTERIDGMYAFAIYDRRKGQLFIAVDHAAIKPLFYAARGRSFAFASEPKGIVSLMREEGTAPVIDREAVDLYLTLGYVPAPRTIYEGIRRLPPGTRLIYDLPTGKLSEERYPSNVSPPPSHEELKILIERRVEAHLVADVPIGVFFSGGTDSSLIVSILHARGVSLKTFSLRVAGRGQDRKYFEAISKELALDARVYDFGVEEFDGVYEEIVSKIDEPLYDNSLFPTYFIAKQAAKEITVVLSGEGGDECFGGYPRSVVLAGFGDAPMDTDLGVAESLYFVLPAFFGKNTLFERLYAFLCRPIAYYLLAMSPARSLLTLPLWRAAKRELVARVNRPRDLDANLYLVNDLLRKTDEATMYCSIEGRVPLLDRSIVAAAKALPEADLRDGILKPVLKRILAEYLPRELVYRGKSGFGVAADELFRRSRFLKNDVVAAADYLGRRGLLRSFRLPKVQTLIRRYPQLCFALIALYHSVRNAERW